MRDPALDLFLKTNGDVLKTISIYCQKLHQLSTHEVIHKDTIPLIEAVAKLRDSINSKG